MKKIPFILALLAFLVFACAGSAIECMGCHQYDSDEFPQINTSVFGVHVNVNSTDGAGNLTSRDCIACHYSANTSALHGMPVSRFPMSTYTCEDCHISGISPAAPVVYNHIGNASVSVTASCGACHNKTSNLFKYSANASAAHYGSNPRFGLSPGEPYCDYCHANSSTIYRDVMQNKANTMIGNHTSGIINPSHPAGRPDCASCHGMDSIHGGDLRKPVPDSGFCNDCHKFDRLKKEKHAGNVECIQCHTDTASDIHTIKYLLQDGTYRNINATKCVNCHDFRLAPPYFKLPFSPANCTTCHQGNGQIRFAQAPHIPTPLNHSLNPSSGGLWNNSQPAYWANQESACYYCHGNTLHNKNALGNVTNVKSGNSLNQSLTTTSFWCANCHYKGIPSGNYSYNGTSFTPVPPEIQNKFGLVGAKSNAGTTFFNHSLAGYSDAVCVVCHAKNSPATSSLFVHNVGPGAGGPDCIMCHDSRIGGAPADKRIDLLAFNKSVHYGLNGGGSAACWACHGNGTKPTGHPEGYKTPKKCSNDECHSLDQEFRAPMVYSHFKNASLNDNPTNILNYNVTTGNNCQECHVNSVYSQGRNINSTVSHYASSDLPDTINCIYCHLNEDNSKKWGNATLIYENRTALVELDRKNNKFTAREGESLDLGSSFTLKVLEVSSVRESALIEIIKKNISVDKSLVSIGNYTYEEYLTIDNVSIKVPLIVINVTGIFKGNDTGFIQFEGFRLKRVHPENKSTSCYSCHVYVTPKIKYKVIDRVSGEKDEIYYTREMVNFSDKWIFNEPTILQLLQGLTDEDMHANIQPQMQKALYEGETWNISQDTSLVIKGVDTKNENVFLHLETGNYVYEDIVNRGDIFEFRPSINYLGNQPENITIFRAKVSGIVHATAKTRVILEDVVALSPDIKKILANQTLAGYNASWLWENSTINVGKIPENFHSPQLFDGVNGGANCLTCHGKDGFSSKKVLSLGKHDMLNGGGDNACRACHGGTKDSKAHPASYKNPRKCVSCHASLQDNYSAVYIGDEEHRNQRCEDCHVSNIHEITRLHMTPAIKKISIIKEDNRTILKASVLGGNKMKVRDARYFIDSGLEKIEMYPVDGVFDSQAEEVYAQMDLLKLSPGKHVVYVEAMERKDNWGVPSSLEFTIESGSLKENKTAGMLTFADTSALLLIVFFLRYFK